MKKFVRVLIANEHDSYLIIEEKRSKNLWNFPGGKVEKDEAIVSSCIREVFEETNLIINDVKFLFKNIFAINGERWMGYYFITKNVKGSIKLKEEKSINYNYILPAEFANYDNFIVKALDYLKGGDVCV
ncbi:MAG: NUDIX hydrolase [Oscillospiraceae bacterium]|nr:NUDIX hydrolase [Oscillospiraceae bacterium]